MEYKRATIAKVKDTIVIPAIDLIEVKPEFDFPCRIDSRAAIEIRSSGSFTNKAFWLSSDYDWVVRKDDANELCLIPLKKVR